MRRAATPLVLLCAAVASAQVHQRPGWEVECIALEGDSTLRGSLRPDMIHSEYEYVSRAQQLAVRVEFVAGEIERCARQVQATMGVTLAKYRADGIVAAVRENDEVAAALESCLGPAISRAAEELEADGEVVEVRWNSGAPFEIDMERRGDVFEWRVHSESDFARESHLVFYRVCTAARGSIRVPVTKSPGSTVEVCFGSLVGHFAWDRWFRVNREVRRN